MTAPIERIVDAHVHFWDPARTDWYPYLSGGQELDIGDISGMCRRFFPDTYLAESAAWPVDKVVHVSATGGFIAEETREREEMGTATGHPAAIVGGIRSEQSAAEAIALLDDQMTSSRFRGVRSMGLDPGGVPVPEVLRPKAAEPDMLLPTLSVRAVQVGGLVRKFVVFQSPPPAARTYTVLPEGSEVSGRMTRRRPLST